MPIPEVMTTTVCLFDWGVALLVMAIGAHNKGLNRVGAGKRQEHPGRLCLHHHGALNEGVDSEADATSVKVRT